MMRGYPVDGQDGYVQAVIHSGSPKHNAIGRYYSR